MLKKWDYPKQGKDKFENANTRLCKIWHNLMNGEKNLFCIAKSMGLGTGEQWRKIDYIAHNNPELLEQIGSPGLTVNKAYGIAKQLEKRKNLLKMIPAEGTDGSAIIRYGFFERLSNVYWK